MTASAEPQVLIDGRAPTMPELVHLALVNYGYFTAMQVRGGAVRGLGLHLARLRQAHAELFGTELDLERLRHLMRKAVADRPDAYLRVTLFEPNPGSPCVMTAVRPPIEAGRTPISLSPVHYVRPFAHLKHVGSFAQIRFGNEVERQGFDDALLVTVDGLVAETTMANIGFLSGANVIWPDAPCLRGITWQVLDGCLTSVGKTSRVAQVLLDAVSSYEAAFVSNSIGIVPVGQIGTHRYDEASARVAPIVATFEASPWDVV